ncbi:hypothetical protein JRO89_XS02G0162500 [Xanthoceras sorbifolium]|uniref:Bifunctional inhibitor/plant lipid transfer protein/seed storage helical domain-containing protein n=1 Tax=Xanthoceras sorbifolium TaxID=99658 RepID=A0ABQ8IG00_9ROSI|nr:hypothetical protein JRO89_XS02G0162500 [Xanthoceras sorbifolium]
MAAAKVALALIVSMLVVDYGQAAAAPAPAADCSSLILNMADCLSFVSAGSTVTKPEGTCCSGLKTVLKSDSECLCEAFKSSASLGVTLNVTKALSLPSACKLSAPSATNCKLSASPSGAPVMAPTAGGIESPSTIVGSNEPAPAPAPGVSTSSVLSISLGPLVLAFLLALFSSY